LCSSPTSGTRGSGLELFVALAGEEPRTNGLNSVIDLSADQDVGRRLAKLPVALARADADPASCGVVLLGNETIEIIRARGR
jgi:hypothetical protein